MMDWIQLGACADADKANKLATDRYAKWCFIGRHRVLVMILSYKPNIICKTYL